MMVYNESKKNILLFRINPFIKILLLTFITLIVTFDYKPFFPMAMFVLCLITCVFLCKIKLSDFWETISAFFLISLGFFIFTLISKGLQAKQYSNIVIGKFSWSYNDILISLSLSFRILTIAAYSAVFVITTNPVDFILSLIKYLHLPYKIGYAVLAAYRFLPTFKDEIMTIKFAHEIRGVNNSKRILNKFISLKRYLIPMLLTAVRKGERISIAMETKAFGAYETRTNFREPFIRKIDVIFLISSTAICITIFIILYNLNLINMSLGFSLN